MKLQSPQLAELFKTSKRKTYKTAGITAVLVGVFVFFGLRPAFKQIANLNKEIADKQEFLAKIDSKLETVNYLITQERSVENELTYFEEDFPTEEKSGFLVANLAAIAAEYNVDLTSVEFNEEIEELDLEVDDLESISAVGVNIILEGELFNLEQYIPYLETFSRIFDIRSISYSATDITRFRGELSDFSPIQCNVSMYVYYWAGQEGEES